MKIVMIIAASIAGSFGFCLAGLWALDTYLIGEFESESVPAGKLAQGLLVGTAVIIRALLQDSARACDEPND
jgi:hypothetical protein